MQMASRLERKDHAVDMTTGSIFLHLLRFSLPLLAGNMFQQLYNTVDTWVVGNYIDSFAFAAVGSVSPVINVLIGAFMGFATGTGVLVSQYYGAKAYEKVREVVHTSAVLTFFAAAAFSVIGVIITPAMLRFMKVPENVLLQAQRYLTIYFSGISGLLIYNMASGILRATGDAKRPFVYLLISAVVNIVLDILFVVGCGMGVEGVAYATVIAQGVSAVLTILCMLRNDTCVKLSVRCIRIDIRQMHMILKLGAPTALQMVITAFSNAFIQSYINVFGADCMGGWTVYSKIDQLILLPIQSLSLAITTFVGQNLGLGQLQRAKRGVRVALTMSVAVTELFAAVILLNASELSAIFNRKPEVAAYASIFLTHLVPCLVLGCINMIYAGALRGAGNTKSPSLITVCSLVVFRQCYFYVMANYICNEVIPIAMGHAAGWLVCSLLTLAYYCAVPLNRYVVAKE